MFDGTCSPRLANKMLSLRKIEKLFSFDVVAPKEIEKHYVSENEQERKQEGREEV